MMMMMAERDLKQPLDLKVKVKTVLHKTTNQEAMLSRQLSALLNQ